MKSFLLFYSFIYKKASGSFHTEVVQSQLKLDKKKFQFKDFSSYIFVVEIGENFVLMF